MHQKNILERSKGVMLIFNKQDTALFEIVLIS